MTQEITVQPTKGFTTPPKGLEFTARIRTTDGGGISGKSNYGSTAEEAKANLLARLEREGISFEDENGEPVTQYILPNGMLSDKRYGDADCCNECFVTSHDVQRGFLTVAVPEGCGDEDCDCHQPTEAKQITPYCETGGKPTLSEIAVFAAVVMALFIFGLGLQVAEGAK